MNNIPHIGKIYDISQEVFTCAVYPGDSQPERIVAKTLVDGGSCNLTEIRMCAHNGTHLDAPYHFFDEGKTIDQLDPDLFIGPAYVSEHTGELSAADAEKILHKAKSCRADCAERILIKGDTTVTEEAAAVFAAAGIKLLGNESQTVGPVGSPGKVHRILLGADLVLLEGIRLKDVPVGCYLLNAAPLNLGSADGAPCRAILLAFE